MAKGYGYIIRCHFYLAVTVRQNGDGELSASMEEYIRNNLSESAT